MRRFNFRDVVNRGAGKAPPASTKAKAAALAAQAPALAKRPAPFAFASNGNGGATASPAATRPAKATAADPLSDPRVTAALARASAEGEQAGRRAERERIAAILAAGSAVAGDDAEARRLALSTELSPEAAAARLPSAAARRAADAILRDAGKALADQPRRN